MRTLLGIILSLLFWISLPASSPAINITALYGANVACDASVAGCIAFPLTLTTICTAGCPKQTSFSFTDSTRFWGSSGGVSSCRTSTDSGATWGACASQAFVAGTAAEYYAGAADGSVLAVGSPGSVCTIRRSTNNGTAWADVFSQAGACTTGGLEGQRLYCLADGRCHYIDVTGTRQVFASSNSGVSWTATASANIAPNCNMAGTYWDGGVGIAPSELTGCGGGGVARAASLSGTWTDSVTWDGTQGDCWGATAYNGAGIAVCFAAPNYTVRTAAGALQATIILPGSLALIDSGGPAISIATNSLYVFANPAASGTSVWLSRDGLATFTLLGTFGGGAAVRGGNTFYTGGCVYITAAQGTPMFGKVCP